MRNQDFLKMIEKLLKENNNSNWKLWAAVGIIGTTVACTYFWLSRREYIVTNSRLAKQLKDGSEAYRDMVFKNSNLVQVNGQQELTIISQQRENEALLKKLSEIQGASKNLS